MNADYSLDSLATRVAEWADGLFGVGDGDRRALEVRRKFKEEAAEFLDSEIDADPIRQDGEAADCLVALLMYDHRRGGAVREAAEVKMGINEARRWMHREDGTAQHVPEAH